MQQVYTPQTTPELDPSFLPSPADEQVDLPNSLLIDLLTEVDLSIPSTHANEAETQQDIHETQVHPEDMWLEMSQAVFNQYDRIYYEDPRLDYPREEVAGHTLIENGSITILQAYERFLSSEATTSGLRWYQGDMTSNSEKNLNDFETQFQVTKPQVNLIRFLSWLTNEPVTQTGGSVVKAVSLQTLSKENQQLEAKNRHDDIDLYIKMDNPELLKEILETLNIPFKTSQSRVADLESIELVWDGRVMDIHPNLNPLLLAFAPLRLVYINHEDEVVIHRTSNGQWEPVSPEVTAEFRERFIRNQYRRALRMAKDGETLPYSLRIVKQHFDSGKSVVEFFAENENDLWGSLPMWEPRFAERIKWDITKPEFNNLMGDIRAAFPQRAVSIFFRMLEDLYNNTLFEAPDFLFDPEFVRDQVFIAIMAEKSSYPHEEVFQQVDWRNLGRVIEEFFEKFPERYMHRLDQMIRRYGESAIRLIKENEPNIEQTAETEQADSNDPPETAQPKKRRRKRRKKKPETMLQAEMKKIKEVAQQLLSDKMLNRHYWGLTHFFIGKVDAYDDKDIERKLQKLNDSHIFVERLTGKSREALLLIAATSDNQALLFTEKALPEGKTRMPMEIHILYPENLSIWSFSRIWYELHADGVPITPGYKEDIQLEIEEKIAEGNMVFTIEEENYGEPIKIHFHNNTGTIPKGLTPHRLIKTIGTGYIDEHKPSTLYLHHLPAAALDEAMDNILHGKRK